MRVHCTGDEEHDYNQSEPDVITTWSHPLRRACKDNEQCRGWREWRTRSTSTRSGRRRDDDASCDGEGLVDDEAEEAEEAEEEDTSRRPAARTRRSAALRRACAPRVVVRRWGAVGE